MALVCAKYFNIKDVSPDLYRIAAPVCELACFNKNGERIYNRSEIEDAIPWNERSLKTFGVVYRYESTASFISTDGKTYVVPNDRPVLDYLKECGYVIAPNGLNFDGSTSKNDSLVFEEKDEYLIDYNIIDRNLPKKIVEKIDEIEGGRPYFTCKQDYAALIRFG